MLSCQVSNLNSSDPETDVLPITPQDNFHYLEPNVFVETNYWFLLTCQGSNLDSTEPKSVVLPITPQVNPSLSFL